MISLILNWYPEYIKIITIQYHIIVTHIFEDQTRVISRGSLQNMIKFLAIQVCLKKKIPQYFQIVDGILFLPDNNLSKFNSIISMPLFIKCKLCWKVCFHQQRFHVGVLVRQCCLLFVFVCAEMRSISPGFDTLRMHSRHSRCANGVHTLSYANLFMNMFMFSIYLMQHSARCNAATAVALSRERARNVCARARAARMIYRQMLTTPRV